MPAGTEDTTRFNRLRPLALLRHNRGRRLAPGAFGLFNDPWNLFRFNDPWNLFRFWNLFRLPDARKENRTEEMERIVGKARGRVGAALK